MKIKLPFVLLILILLLVSSCIYIDDDGGSQLPPPLPSTYEPVIVKRNILEASTELQTPREIINSGKIYVKDNFLFVGEKNEGFHIFNNANPASPEKIAFLKVLGASDLSIKNDVFYINNATDLIALKPDLSTNKIEITKRVTKAFPQIISPDGFEYYDLKEDDIIVNWKKRG